MTAPWENYSNRRVMLMRLLVYKSLSVSVSAVQEPLRGTEPAPGAITILKAELESHRTRRWIDVPTL